MTALYKSKFLKPDLDKPSWQDDRSDLDLVQSTSFVFNPHVSLSIEQQRQRLPIFRNRNHILYLLEKFQTLVIVGETGCGKSTQVPQYMMEAGWGADGTMIGITQPRRVAATTLASRVEEEKGTILGHIVGYSIRFDDCFDPQTTRIKYMTEGILVREMMGDPLLKNYCAVMLDEVHERTLYTDILLGLMKKIVKKRHDLRLIVSSATVDAESLRDFFNTNTTKDRDKDTAVILSVEGRTYPVVSLYVQEPVPDYVKAAVETTVKLHQHEPPGDVLVFLTGQEEVDHAVSLLKEHARRFTDEDNRLWVLPMYGSLTAAEQLKVFRSVPKTTRKVVIATNIAEASITISGIVYVVDSGFVKLRWFNPVSHIDVLVIMPVSQASAEQRAGRAGRVRSGKVYRLYREEDFHSLSVNTPSEMQRTNLASAVLQLKALGIDNVLRFNFPSAPPARNLCSALELLYALGALNEKGQLTTPLGIQMAEFPLGPMFSKMLLVSEKFGCSEEILSLTAMLQIQNVFVTPPGQSAKTRIAKRRFEVKEGDLLTLLNVFDAYLRNEQAKKWCTDNYLNYRGLKRAQEVRNQMKKMLQKFKISLVSCDGDTDSICRCITSGFFPNAAYLHYSGVYKTVRGGHSLHIHPTSVLYTLEQPQWVLFTEVLHTNKEYMRDLTVIDPAWLEDLAPHFYEKTTER